MTLLADERYLAAVPAQTDRFAAALRGADLQQRVRRMTHETAVHRADAADPPGAAWMRSAK